MKTPLGTAHSLLVEGETVADLLEVCGLDGGTPYGLLVTFIEADAYREHLALRPELARLHGDDPMFVAHVPGGGAFVLRRAR